MFALVKDVESYPRFLPWCHSAKILQEVDQQVCAEIVVARLGIRQPFSTCNRYEQDKWMSLELKEGPFRHLRGAWTFTALRHDACKVELEMEFEFAGGMINKAFGSVFHHVANTLVSAFCKQAEEVYGR